MAELGERMATVFDGASSSPTASGGVSLEAHDMAVRRMVRAGAVPITTTAVLGEWQRDWAREETAAGVAAVVLERRGAATLPAYNQVCVGMIETLADPSSTYEL